MEAHLLKEANDRRSLAKGIVNRAIQVLLSLIAWAAFYFIAAGRLDLPYVWIYLAFAVLVFGLNLVVLIPRNPEVIVARGRTKRGTKGFDLVFSVIFLLSTLAIPVVAGLDAVRFGWSALPAVLFWPGIVLNLVGNIPILWAMAVNPHLEKTVRIQEDHRVITAGPYRHVRHPMYVGVILQNFALPLILGSLWAFVPVATAVLSLVVRTSLEDRTLRKELSGYEEFSGKTRYRLVPGVW